MSRPFLSQVITDDSALGGSVIERSLRFNDDDNAYLQRQPSSNTSGSSQKITISFWIKLGNIPTGTNGGTFFGTAGNSHRGQFFNQELYFQFGSNNWINTTGVFRDPSAWYHVVYVVDTTQSTTSNRQKIYVNGVLQGRGDTISDPSQNAYVDYFNNSSETYYIGRRQAGNYFDGYLAEIHFIDGYAYDQSYFGFTEQQTGIWRPKRYEGTHGTNGFYLDFSDNSSTSTLGIDKSLNGNDFTPNNFSVSAGDGNDSLEDTPTNNFATFNPLVKSANTFSDGNLKVTCTSSTPAAFHSTLGVSSGKYYMEFLVKSVNNYPIGISGYTNHPDYYSNGDEVGFWIDDVFTRVFRNGSNITSNSVVVGNFETGVEGSNTSWAVDDIAGLALDMDEQRIYLYKGSTQVGYVDFSGFGYEKVFFGGGNYISGNVYIGNFGQRPFSYTPPSGYKTLNSKNLPPNVPSIIRPQKHFDTILYTGDGATSARAITGLEFAPDFVWLKNRETTYYHQLHDTVRGVSGGVLYSSQTDSEDSTYSLASFDTNGFSISKNNNQPGQNNNGDGHVAWCWKAGGTAVSNSDGSITSQVSANTEAGFSIVTWTGNGSDGATVGHGLGTKPDWIIIKKRDNNSGGNTGNWIVQHKSLSNGVNANTSTFTLTSYSSSAIYLNLTNGESSYGFDNQVNGNTDTFVAYCWYEVPGYSKFGSYTGNGNADGPYVDLGFRPAWLVMKRIDSTSNWEIVDNKRDPFNFVNEDLSANNANAENAVDGTTIDFLSNGFKHYDANSTGTKNVSGGTYIYMAFAEQPVTTPYETFSNAR